MISFFKKEKTFLTIFSISIIVFLWDLLFLKKTFVLNDYKQQFFPWSMAYADAIKHFTLPFWMPNMGCGFPLVAEGQIGPFYPLNIVLFFILPPIAAYSYGIILHFILGGIFMYLFSKKIGLTDMAAIVPSILFMFASPYAGCFSNIASLKVLCWFPLILYMIYVSFEKRKPYILCFMGAVMGMQLLAGAPQMAFYSIFFSSAYLIFMLFCSKNGHRGSYLTAFFIGGIIALAVAMPQITASSTLISLSNRGTRDLSFALAKSFIPAGLLTLLFPYTAGIFEGMFYVGVLPLIFAIIAVFGRNKDKQLLFFIGLFLFSFLCAMGRYNPLYSTFLKVTKFYLFRIPSKFLFFSAFSLIVMAGFGLQGILKNTQKKDLRKANIISLSVLAFSVITVILANISLRVWNHEVVSFAKEYVMKYFYNPHLHKYPIQYYLNKVSDIYQNALSAFSFSNMYTCIQLAILLISVVLIVSYNKKVVRSGLYKWLFLCVLFFDLLLFGMTGRCLSENIGSIPSITMGSKEVNELKRDNSLFRVFIFKPYESQGILQPNLNMYFGIDNIGIYSPLVFKRYYDLFNDMGCIDDSTGVVMPSEEALYRNMTLLSMLNVKYIISGKELSYYSLEFIKDINGGDKIYINKGVLPRAFIVHNTKVTRNESEIIALLKDRSFVAGATAILEEDLTQTLSEPSGLSAVEEAKIAEYTDRRVVIKTSTNFSGLLIFSDYYYPEWKAYLDGKRIKTLRANYILRAVYLPKGEHEVRFVYER